MNFAAVLEALNQASGFELYRLRAALDRILDDPKWIIPIAQQLHQGQRIDYFDCQGNTTRSAQVLELRNKRVLVRDEQDGRSWLIPYAAINLAGVDVRIRKATPTGLGRHEIAVGDTLGFLDRDGRQQSGQVIRLNDKSVTLHNPRQGYKWRVPYVFLHRVVEIDAEEIIQAGVIKG